MFPAQIALYGQTHGNSKNAKLNMGLTCKQTTVFSEPTVFEIKV